MKWTFPNLAHFDDDSCCVFDDKLNPGKRSELADVPFQRCVGD